MFGAIEMTVTQLPLRALEATDRDTNAANIKRHVFVSDSDVRANHGAFPSGSIAAQQER